MQYAINAAGDIHDAHGQPARDVDKLDVFKAINGLYQALANAADIEPRGPLPIVICMPVEVYDRFERNMLAADEFSRMFFGPKDCRGRKRDRRECMIAGIRVVALDG